MHPDFTPQKLLPASPLPANITCRKQPQRGPGPRHPKWTRGSVSHELSTPQDGRASPKQFATKKHLKTLTGQTTNRKKDKSNNIIRAVLWCVSVYASLSRAPILYESSITRTVTCNIPTDPPQRKSDPECRNISNTHTRMESQHSKGPNEYPRAGDSHSAAM